MGRSAKASVVVAWRASWTIRRSSAVSHQRDPSCQGVRPMATTARTE